MIMCHAAKIKKVFTPLWWEADLVKIIRESVSIFELFVLVLIAVSSALAELVLIFFLFDIASGVAISPMTAGVIATIRFGLFLIFLKLQSRFAFKIQTTLITAILEKIIFDSRVLNDSSFETVSSILTGDVYQIVHRGALLFGTLLFDLILIITLAFWLITLFPIQALLFFFTIAIPSIFCLVLQRRALMQLAAAVSANWNSILQEFRIALAQIGLIDRTQEGPLCQKEVAQRAMSLEQSWGKSNFIEQGYRGAIEYFGLAALGAVYLTSKENPEVSLMIFAFISLRLLPIGFRLVNSLQGIHFAGSIANKLQFVRATKKRNIDCVSDAFMKRSGLILITGNSGAGKTTGAITAARAINSEAGFAYLPQAFPLSQRQYKRLHEEVWVPSRAEQKIIETLMTNHDQVEKFSGGERQRLALLYTLRQGVDRILLDEPFSALDDEAFEKCWALVSEVSSNRLVVVISHKIPTETVDAIRLNV